MCYKQLANKSNYVLLDPLASISLQAKKKNEEEQGIKNVVCLSLKLISLNFPTWLDLQDGYLQNIL